MEWTNDHIRELYTLVCIKIELTLKTEKAAVALYKYILSLDDLNLWPPNTSEKERHKLWTKLLGSKFNPISKRHRTRICKILSKRIANVIIDSNNNNNNNTSFTVNDFSNEIIFYIAEILAESNVSNLKPLLSVDKTWNLIANEIYQRKMTESVAILNFFVNLWYHVPDTYIVIYKEEDIRRVTSEVIDVGFLDNCLAVLYQSEMLLMREDRSEIFMEYISKKLKLRYHYMQDNDTLTIQANQTGFPSMQEHERVFIIHPRNFMEALTTVDENLHLVIEIDFFFTDISVLRSGLITRAENNMAPNFSIEDEIEYMRGAFEEERFVNKELVNKLPLRLIERHLVVFSHDNQVGRQYPTTKIIPIYTVSLNKVASFIKQNPKKLIDIPWFTKDMLKEYLEPTVYHEFSYVLTDENFLTKYLTYRQSLPQRR